MDTDPRSETTPAQTGAAEDKLDVLVEQLRLMKRNSKLSLAIDVGRLVVEQVYGSDREALQRRGKDHAGFRRLAAHPKLPFSKSTLWRYVGVSEIVTRMPGLVRCEMLTVAHLSAVLRSEPEAQERLLKLAVKLRWTAARLELEAKKASDTHRPRQKPSLLIAIRRLERLRADVPDLGRVNDLAEKERDRIRRVIADTKTWCEAIDCWLAAGDAVN